MKKKSKLSKILKIVGIAIAVGIGLWLAVWAVASIYVGSVQD